MMAFVGGRACMVQSRRRRCAGGQHTGGEGGACPDSLAEETQQPGELRVVFIVQMET